MQQDACMRVAKLQVRMLNKYYTRVIDMNTYIFIYMLVKIYMYKYIYMIYCVYLN